MLELRPINADREKLRGEMAALAEIADIEKAGTTPGDPSLVGEAEPASGTVSVAATILIAITVLDLLRWREMAATGAYPPLS